MFFAHLHIYTFPVYGVPNSKFSEQKNMNTYVSQFVGQDIQHIRETTDLNSFNIHLKSNLVIRDEREIFTFERIVNTAIPMGNSMRDENGFMIPVQTTSVNQYYDNLMTCSSVFSLKKQYRFQKLGNKKTQLISCVLNESTEIS